MKDKIKKAFGGNSFRYGTYSVVLTAVVIAIIVVINVLVAGLPSAVTNVDMTSVKLYSIGETTEELVGALKEDVTIYVIAAEGSENKTLMQMLDKYVDLSSHVKVEQVDPNTNPVLLTKYNLNSDEVDLSGTNLLVVSDKRSKFIPYSDIDSYVYGDYAMLYYQYYGDSSYLATNYCGEKEVTSAIVYVTTDDLPVMYTLTGHSEWTLATGIQSLLSDNNYTVKELNLISAGAVPEDADIIAIICPSSDFTEDEVSILENYVAYGGKCIIINYSNKQKDMPNYSEFLAYYGVTIPSDGFVFESAGYNYQQVVWQLYEPLTSSHSIVSSMDTKHAVLTTYAQPILQVENMRNTLKIESFLTTSNGSWFRTDLSSTPYEDRIDSDVDGPFDLGVVITDQSNEGEGQIILYSAYDIIKDTYVNGNYPFANADLFLSSVNYLSKLTYSISIPAKSSSLSYNVDTTSAEFFSGLIVFVIAIPLAVLVTGFVIWIRRRR